MFKISAGWKWVGIAAMVFLLASVPVFAQEPKPESEQKQGPIKPKKEKPPEDEAFTLSIDVPLLNFEVTVVDRNGNFVTGLHQDHFRVFMDKQEAEITAFAPSQATMTTVILLEADASLFWYDNYRNLEAVSLFLNQLQKGDWIALMGYDMKSRLEADFTQDPRDIMAALRRMQIPTGFSESNLYDALLDTLDRVKEIEGRKSVLIIGRGIDTFSKITWGKLDKQFKKYDTTIFAIGMTWLEHRRNAGFGQRAAMNRMTLNMAEAQLKHLAEKTGGRAFFPRFQAELPRMFEVIGAIMRNQYTLSIRPQDLRPDGKFHKIKVQLLGPDGKKLIVTNQNGKKLKYQIYYREGFYAPVG